jgi:hypothetical protein
VIRNAGENLYRVREPGQERPEVADETPEAQPSAAEHRAARHAKTHARPDGRPHDFESGALPLLGEDEEEESP